MLNLSKAIQLYRLIGPYLPPNSDDTVSNVVQYIISKMVENNDPVYVDVIMLITGKSIEELKEKSTSDLLELFTIGLMENEVFHLREFCEVIHVAR